MTREIRGNCSDDVFYDSGEHRASFNDGASIRERRENRVCLTVNLFFKLNYESID